MLIAEDEPPTLRRIKRLIEQLDSAFLVSATAGDGEEALALLNRQDVDVLFTDIRMPIVDGLQLMDEVRAKWPDCLVVVLSGYQDFEYVSHAVRARAMDYLLKPVTEEALSPLLARLKQAYMQMRRAKLRGELAVRINKAAAPAPRPAAASEADEIGLALFLAGPMPLGSDPEMCAGASVWSGLSLEGLLNELLPGYVSFTWEFMGDSPAERILIFQTEGGEPGRWLRYLHEAVLERADLPICCAFRTTLLPLSEVGGALRSLRRALKERVAPGRSLFLPLAPGEAAAADEGDLALNDLAAALRDQMKSGGVSAAQRRELFARFEREQWTQRRIHRLFQEAVALAEVDAGPEKRAEYAQFREIVADSIGSAVSLKDLEADLAPILSGGDADAQAPAAQLTAQEIRQYLEAHYDQHITNQTLSAVFGYVPSYISILFRRAFDASPSEYLTKLRLERAKQLMRSQPELLIRDIAETVGFKSQHHFSRTFKKYEGVWPTDYKP